MSAPPAASVAPLTQPPRSKVFRPEIEGLRAVAAFLVMVWHIWVGGVSGGVDVFFVVSGFLITTTLLGQLDRFGEIRPFMFLGRLARRLLPSAIVVLLVTLLGVWAITPAALRERAFREIFASALYFENWQLAFAAVDYLDSEDPHSPVQHFWAMSIQGQFYVIWAAIFALSALILRRRLVAIRRTVAVAIAIVFVVSLAYSIWRTYENQPFTYFDTAARAWEFALGALAAFVIARVVLNRPLSLIAGWLGLAGVVLCGALLPVASSFPGYAALWPTVSALLILAAGSGRDNAGHAPWLLSRRPLVWLGGLSYGIYLWHWPLLVFARQILGRHEVGLVAGIMIILAAVLLSWLTTTLVERPIRAIGERTPRRRLVAGLLLVAIAGGVAGGAVVSRDMDRTLSQERTAAAQREAEQAGELGCYGVEALATGLEACASSLSSTTLLPVRSSLLGDTGGAYGCYTAADDVEITSCTFGSERLDAVSVAIVGNSHAAMLAATLRPELDDLNWRLDTFVGNGCVWGSGNTSERCVDRLAQIDEHLLGAESYDLVIASNGRGEAGYSAELERSYLASWEQLAEKGTRVVVVEDNPRMTQEAADCVVAASDDELRQGLCDFEAGDGYGSPDMMVEAAESSGGAVPVVPTADWYCVDGICPAAIGGVIVYRDRHHLTITYLRTVAPLLAEQLKAATD